MTDNTSQEFLMTQITPQGCYFCNVKRPLARGKLTMRRPWTLNLEHADCLVNKSLLNEVNCDGQPKRLHTMTTLDAGSKLLKCTWQKLQPVFTQPESIHLGVYGNKATTKNHQTINSKNMVQQSVKRIGI